MKAQNKCTHWRACGAAILHTGRQMKAHAGRQVTAHTGERAARQSSSTGRQMKAHAGRQVTSHTGEHAARQSSSTGRQVKARAGRQVTAQPAIRQHWGENAARRSGSTWRQMKARTGMASKRTHRRACGPAARETNQGTCLETSTCAHWRACGSAIWQRAAGSFLEVETPKVNCLGKEQGVSRQQSVTLLQNKSKISCQQVAAGPVCRQSSSRGISFFRDC